MSFNDEYRTCVHYKKLLELYGANYLALNWGSEQSQLLRFSILTEIGDLTGCSVLDVGCGLGDLAGWLQSRKIDVNYVGLDLADSLIERARQRYPEKRFVVGSITDPAVLRNEKFDFVVASGIFATYSEARGGWMEQAVSRMWEFSILGVAFNSLSTWAPKADPDEYYADPIKVMDFCRSFTSKLQIRHDYHPRDFTMYLYREILG